MSWVGVMSCGNAARIAVFAALTLLAPRPAGAAPLAPAAHADFAYYTFALTWQPGFCQTGDGCLSNQPKAPLIGIHGLWASQPQTLIAQGIVVQQWWQHGCDYFRHSDAAPVLDAAVGERIEAVMPHLANSLLTHEFDKHVQCFGFDPNAFFATELTMRDAVANSAFGRFLERHAGSDAAHTDVVAAFRSAFATNAGTSLQLQCEPGPAGLSLLTQLWITVDARRLGDFPRTASLLAAPIAQDTCPANFHIPAWNDASPPD